MTLGSAPGRDGGTGRGMPELATGGRVIDRCEASGWDGGSGPAGRGGGGAPAGDHPDGG